MIRQEPFVSVSDIYFCRVVNSNKIVDGAIGLRLLLYKPVMVRIVVAYQSSLHMTLGRTGVMLVNDTKRGGFGVRGIGNAVFVYASSS